MRLIDADALWHDIETADWYNNADRDGVVEPIILHAPTINGWISVKDRLPEKSGNVLVCYGEYNCMMVLNYSCRHHAFNASDGLPDAENKIDDVKYWMSIPEPPKDAMQND